MALFGTRKKRDPWRMAPEPPPYQGGYDLTDQDLTPQPTMPSTMPTTPQNPEPQGMMGGSRPPGFWGGGDKFTTRDGLAGLLAVIGDAFSNRGGVKGGAVNMLASGRTNALELAKTAQEQQAVVNQLIASGVSYDDAVIMARDKTAVREQLGQKYQKPSESTFVQQMRLAGIDPESPQGRALLQQKLATDSSPPASLIGSPESGWTWHQPPAPSLPNAVPQFNVGGEWMTPPVLGPSLEEIRAERLRRQRGR